MEVVAREPSSSSPPRSAPGRRPRSPPSVTRARASSATPAGRRGRLLSLWIDHPERVLSTLLIGNTLVNIGAGALAAAIGASLATNAATGVTAATAIATVVILFLARIIPKTLGKRHPVRVSLAVIPFVRPLSLGDVAARDRRDPGDERALPPVRRRARLRARGDERGDRVPHRDGHAGGRPRRGEGGAPQQRARVRRPRREGDHGAAHADGGDRPGRPAGRAVPDRHREPVQPHARVRGVDRQRRRRPARARDHPGSAPFPGDRARPLPEARVLRAGGR